MKKFLSILMVLAMVLSLSITAFAAEETGSITITNATIDQTYTAYKIFDASIKLAADGETAEAVSYTIETDKANTVFRSSLLVMPEGNLLYSDGTGGFNPSDPDMEDFISSTNPKYLYLSENSLSLSLLFSMA